ncbi:hypothetical protein PACILC2_07260 [Paenibacillus cisolokensis]|uniref:Rhamnogalacturonase A/B/Epimerase-like pectate lyase domain-containing protein n=1 Tax=Paenibacillus cisolokensis TaxID=1658519 RepID=A0ABQ4N1V1_9BACL|nr:glycosyl hydrolase family 28-related protein [Paenibacillus cisolokensis]GIQ62158.1 hypothetical protein PACILC2_07260 [Paenibacillus cisolokensis]
MASPMRRVNELVSSDIGNYLTNKKTWGGIIYNVMDYGAKGDGVKDDTAAIQKAIDIAKNSAAGTIYFPPGDYVINSTILVQDVPNLAIMSFNNARILTYTVDLDFMFSFKNCPGLEINNIQFDSNNTGKSQLKLERCAGFTIEKCSFKNFKQDETDIFRHAIRLDQSPNGTITGNLFQNIGQSFGGSMTVNTQYRSITANSGCNRITIKGNKFLNVHQSLVVAEFPLWDATKSYSVNNYVLYTVGETTNVYRCIQANTGIQPSNTSYWKIDQEDVIPNHDVFFLDNYNEYVGDNAVYFLEYVRSIVISNNTFINMQDEPIVIVGQNAIIVNNRFENVSNKAIAIGDKDNIEKSRSVEISFTMSPLAEVLLNSGIQGWFIQLILCS